jgi:hypothetical protein
VGFVPSFSFLIGGFHCFFVKHFVFYLTDRVVVLHYVLHRDSYLQYLQLVGSRYNV